MVCLNYVEYGKENNEIIILLHGGGLSWWNYREIAIKLQNKYRIILPILDGHAGSDAPFTTIENNAKSIIKFIEEQLKQSVLCIGGVSLGAQITLEILSKKKDICKYALIESALVLPSKLTRALIKPSLDCSYFLIKYKWFAKMQFKYLKIKDSLFAEYYNDTCAITKENMIHFMQENMQYTLKEEIKQYSGKIHIFAGEKEIASIKKSAQYIHTAIKDSTLTYLPKMNHGEYSLNHPEEYVNHLLKIINEGQSNE